MNTKRLQTAIAIFIPCSNVGFLSAALVYDAYFFHFTILAFIIADVLLYLYLPQGMQMKLVFRIAGLPFLYYLTTAAALFFSNNMFLSLFLLGSLFFLQICYFFIQRGKDTLEKTNSLFSQMSLYICYGIFFSLSIFFFSLIYFLDVPFWHLVLPFLLIILVAGDAIFFRLGIDQYTRVLISLTSAVSITELLYAISWLPLDYLGMTGVASLLYAVYMDILYSSLREEDQLKKKILFSGVLVLCMLFLILALARWR
ncbi:hypothetical protein HY621_00065 [Candidatus Uhrbacteria bacterium]|nr:hypothetical protein [Candidatus Uhrbacteria bacterium]